MLVNELGAFTSRLNIGSLQANLVEAVKQRILDVLASALAGFHLGAHKQLLPILGGAGEVTVWGLGSKLSLRDAVLVNSFLAHATYLDDGDRYSGAHPASVVIPSAIALAEKEHATGEQLIVSVAAGYEVLLRLGQAIYPSAVIRGFQSTAILGAVGSAAACANLLKLTPDVAKNALAISCNLGVGLKEALKSSASQPLQVARACEGGVLAALYAKQGAEGPDRIIEDGFIKAFADNTKIGDAFTGLGTRFRIFDTYIKIHGGCRGNHSPIDVVMDLVKENAIGIETIEKISISVDSVTFASEIHDPRSGSQAQFSIPFAVAVALLEGNASIFQFTDKQVGNPLVRAMMNRIHAELDTSLDDHYPDKRGAVAEITLADGRHFRKRIDNAKGEPEYPLSAVEIESKFFDLTRGVLGNNAERVRDIVGRLDSLKDVAPLLAYLKPAVEQSKHLARAL